MTHIGAMKGVGCLKQQLVNGLFIDYGQEKLLYRSVLFLHYILDAYIKIHVYT